MAKGRKKIIDITPIESEANEVSKELVSYIGEKQLPDTVSSNIVNILSPVFLKIKEWGDKIDSIVIKDADDTASMNTARESRLFIKNTRIDIDRKIKAEIDIVKEKMLPYVEEIDAYKSVFQFAEALMKGIETNALEKEKYAERLKQQKIDDKRKERALVAEPLKQYIGFSLDFGIISDEEFELLIKNARLAQKADEAEKEEQMKREEIRKVELEVEKRYSDRISKLYSIGMVQVENNLTYEELSYDLEAVRSNDNETFNLVFSGLSTKISHKKEEAKKKAEEERLAKEKQDQEEKERLRLEAEKQHIEAEKKRSTIMARISNITGSVIKQDGLYVEYVGGSRQEVFFDTYDNIYSMSDEDFKNKILDSNEKHRKYHEDYRNWKEEQDKIEIEKKAKEMAEQKASKEREDAIRLEEQNKRVQSEMSDKDKIKELLDKIEGFAAFIEVTFVFKSDYGNKVKSDVVTLLSKISSFIKSKL